MDIGILGGALQLGERSGVWSHLLGSLSADSLLSAFLRTGHGFHGLGDGLWIVKPQLNVKDTRRNKRGVSGNRGCTDSVCVGVCWTAG